MARLFSFKPAITFRGRAFHGIRGWAGKPTHPPLTDPAISPSDDTASLAPSRLGAVPSTLTTVAMAIFFPSARHRSIAGTISTRNVSVSIHWLRT